MSNGSPRERFGLEMTMASPVSRLIKDAVEAGLIKVDPFATSKKYARYVPFWA
jgi:hypothetical protein